MPAPTTIGSALPKSPSVPPEPCLQQGNPPGPPNFSGSVAEWTGTTWTAGPTFSAGPPLVPGKGDFVAVGDHARHAVVFYLGSQGETWAWTGKWTQLHPATRPPYLAGAAASYDTTTNQIVLFGGETQDGSAVAIYDTTWAWDGATWLQRSGGPAVAVPIPTPQQIPPGPPCPKPSTKPPVGQALPACPLPTSTGGAGGAPGSAAGAAPATSTAANAG